MVGRMDLNHRPPGPEDCAHEESTSYMECDEILLITTSAALTRIYDVRLTHSSTPSGLVVGTKLGTVHWGAPLQ